MILPASKRLNFSEVPVIDLGSINADGIGKAAQQIGTACQDVGFFYIGNHGVNSGCIEYLHRSAKAFFSQPLQYKNQYRLNHQIRGYLPSGYRSYEGEKRAGTSSQEGFWIGYEGTPDFPHPLDGPNIWPEDPAELKPAMLAYLEQVERLSQTLLRCFASSMELDEVELLSCFSRPCSRLKLNHYPPESRRSNKETFGVVPHTDSGAFTILWQDHNSGLEIQARTGNWVRVPPMKDTLVVNIGNILQIWSNGSFSSTPHRVIMEGDDDRYSIPFFVNPDFDCIIEPMAGDDSGYPAFNYGQYQVDLWRRSFPVAEIPGEGDSDLKALSGS